MVREVRRSISGEGLPFGIEESMRFNMLPGFAAHFLSNALEVQPFHHLYTLNSRVFMYIVGGRVRRWMRLCDCHCACRQSCA